MPSGQLIGSIDDISHSLNPTTLIRPKPSVINNTVQTNSTIEVFKNSALHTKLALTTPKAPVSGHIGRSGEGKGSKKIVVDVVQTESFAPTDSYSKEAFDASRKETDMINYLQQRNLLGLRWPIGTRNIFMITARKIGKKMTVTSDDVSGFDTKAKVGLNVQPGVNIEATLDADWESGIKIKEFSAQACVFAVQVRKVKYHADPTREVTTKKFVKSTVFGKEDEGAEGDGDDADEIAVEYGGLSEEGPTLDSWDEMIVPVGEENFVVKADE
ncbi:hypothetical protein N431DRAFT_519347 [Stipitochalara longipes BDJ]|nr:hypothetical protein N431DRAFT_519347 [Stipitochalara longipes BDJ]